MKTLIVFVGHMRSFAITKPHLIEKLISPLSADVALFTRPTVGFAGYDGLKKSDKSDGAVADFVQELRPVIVESLLPRRIPCGFLSKPEVRRWADERDVRMGLVGMGWWKSSLQSVLGMFELMTHASRRVAQVASRYDMIIRCRPDLEFKSPVDPESFRALASDQKTVGKPDFCNIRGGGGMNDQFFAGAPTCVLPLMDISPSIQRYAAKGVSIQPEVMLGHHLRSVGLVARDIPCDYIIRRVSGKKVDQRRAKD